MFCSTLKRAKSNYLLLVPLIFLRCRVHNLVVLNQILNLVLWALSKEIILATCISILLEAAKFIKEREESVAANLPITVKSNHNWFCGD